MKTAGSMLKEARLFKGLTLAQVEQTTKIRAKFLEAIESDDYTKLPSLAYAKGFVKNYSDFLNLPTDTVLAFFRRQMKEAPKSSLLPKGMAEPLNKPLLRLTPGRFVGILLIALVAAFLLYFGLQYERFNQPPQLSLEAPVNQLVTQEKRIDILGKTEPDATLTINGISVLVRSDGRFFDQVPLVAGVNKLTIVATSRFGKTTTIVREVGLQLP